MATKKASTGRAKSTKTTKTPARIIKTTSVRSAAAGRSSVSDRLSNAPIAAFFAEGIGTFLLAAIVVATQGQPIFVLFALATIILTVGHLSGAHVNPAITFGAWVTRKITTMRAIGYVAFQLFGGMLALVVLNYLVQGSPAQANPLTGGSQAAEIYKAVQVVDGKEWYAFFASLLGMGIFSFAFASALRERREHFAAAFTVGGGLFIGLIVAGAGAILNPAVALSLQSFTDLKGGDALSWALTIQVGATFVGAALGFLLYDLLRRDVDSSAR